MLRPDSRGSRGYLEAFSRRRNLTPEVLSTERLLTDRDAYLNFLEVQLERVSAACLAVQECNAKIDGFTARASSAEDKVLSATKLVRLAQRYSEEQGREQARINDVFEDRLADMERRIVDSRDAQPPGIGCRSLHEEFAYSNSRHRSSRPDSPVLPEIPPISAVDLSDWMRGVDKRLDDLFERRAASPRERRASADGSNTSSEDIFPIGEIRTIGDKEGRNECAEEKKAATSPPRLYVEPPPAPDIVRLEERLRRLEENASATVPGAASPGGDAAGENWNDSPHSGEESGLREIPPSDGGKRRQSCSEPARQDSLLSSIHSPRFSSVPSLQGVSPERPNADDVATGEEHSQDTIMKAVEESTAESRRARELAEEALRVGREAAARSERTENFTKSLASESSKLVEEQHCKVNEVLGRLNEQLRTSRRGSGDDEECKRSLAAEVNSRQSSRRSAFGNGAGTTVAGEDMGSDGAGAGSVGPASCRSNRIGGRERGCGHRVSTEGASPARQPRDSSPVDDCRVQSSARAGADERTEYFSRYSERDIRSILERMPANSVNGRRVAIGAARAALESILCEISPEQEEYKVEVAEEGSGAPVRSEGPGGCINHREGGGMRGRAKESVRRLAEICRSPLPRVKQRRPSRGARRVSRKGVHSPRSRDRAKIPSTRDRSRSKRVGDYWVPPGNVPCRIGERRGGLMNMRAAWDRREDEAEEENMTSGK